MQLEASRESEVFRRDLAGVGRRDRVLPGDGSTEHVRCAPGYADGPLRREALHHPARVDGDIVDDRALDLDPPIREDLHPIGEDDPEKRFQDEHEAEDRDRDRDVDTLHGGGRVHRGATQGIGPEGRILRVASPRGYPVASVRDFRANRGVCRGGADGVFHEAVAGDDEERWGVDFFPEPIGGELFELVDCERDAYGDGREGEDGVARRARSEPESAGLLLLSGGGSWRFELFVFRVVCEQICCV